MTKKWIPIKDKLTIGPKKKLFEELTPQGKYYRKKFEENPEEYKKFLENKKEWYRKNKPRIQKQKAGLARKRLLKIIKMLGGKCDACDELFNPNRERSNLELHHKYYDKKDLAKRSRYGSVSSNLHDVLKMAKDGINPRKKYVLLCKQCHNIETYSHQDPKKTFDMFCWLHEQGIFDEVLKDDDVKNKRITEFL